LGADEVFTESELEVKNVKNLLVCLGFIVLVSCYDLWYEMDVEFSDECLLSSFVKHLGSEMHIVLSLLFEVLYLSS